jgi:hypothetical protein
LKCSKCSSSIEKIYRGGEDLFFFCRPCQLPHDDHGNPLFTTKSLGQAFNPIQHARNAIKQHHKGIAPVTKTALEVSLLQSIQEAYFAGIKDGVLLAYSQDKTQGEPMEKLGVSNEELKAELRQKYNDLKERQQSSGGLSKEASAEMDAIKAKLDELESN